MAPAPSDASGPPPPPDRPSGARTRSHRASARRKTRLPGEKSRYKKIPRKTISLPAKKAEAETDSHPVSLAVLPWDEMALYPDMVMSLGINEARDIKLVESVLAEDAPFVMAPRLAEPTGEDAASGVHDTGCQAKILKFIRLPDNSLRIFVQGVRRVTLSAWQQRDPCLRAMAAPLREIETAGVEADALYRLVRRQFEGLLELMPHVSDEIKVAVANINTPSRFADLVAANINLSMAEHGEMLRTANVFERLLRIATLLARETQILEIGSKIHEDVKSKINKGQKEFFLREQLKTIRRELGEEDERVELADLEKALAEARLPPEAAKEAQREFSRLSRMQPGSAEYTVSRTYLDWMANLPWNTAADSRLDIDLAQRVLEEDHYGLAKIKERILEFLAVRRIHPEGKSPILCFVGPPGVGKTSLGRSIARAMGRKFERVSLGGVRDEAEIRGHRRTYIGSMPGRVIQALRRCGQSNPVIALDEIDKMYHDHRGDPGAALLEVLDGEQNTQFRDHYLDVPFDLSRVAFIVTANQLDTAPPALRDRLEVLSLAGYSEEEKMHIVQRHLLPRVRKEHGLSPRQFAPPAPAIRRVISDYTREAGLRGLERELAALARKEAMAVAKRLPPAAPAPVGLPGAAKPRGRGRASPPSAPSAPLVAITADTLKKLLGPPKFFESAVSATERPGVAIGLAWTPTGGDVLFIEAAKMPGKGVLTLTGRLGEVIKESAAAAMTWLRANREQMELPPDFHEKFDVHVHFPEGAIPKDGPSAGVALVAALTSLFGDRPVRRQLAMTGEVTLRGKVLPVGGIKEKALAARRAGITDIALPSPNMDDLAELPASVRRSIRFHPVSDLREALAIAFPRKPAKGYRVHP